MRPDLFKLAALARSLGIPLGLAPSVSPLLSDRCLERMEDLGLRTISVSLDGARHETHDRIRGMTGHLASTIRAIERLARRGFVVQVNTTVMRRNVEELADVAALVAQAGARIWEVFFLVRVGRGIGEEEITPAEHEDVAHFLVDAARHGFVVRTVEAPFFRRVVAQRRQAGVEKDPVPAFGLGSLYRRLAGRLRRRLGPPTSSLQAQTAGTRDGKGVLFVAHDGEVHPSGFLPLPLGNVRHRDIVEVYRSHPLLRALRDGRFHGRCGLCEFRDICGGSRARAHATSGDPLGEDPACPYVPGRPRAG